MAGPRDTSGGQITKPLAPLAARLSMAERVFSPSGTAILMSLKPLSWAAFSANAHSVWNQGSSACLTKKPIFTSSAASNRPLKLTAETATAAQHRERKPRRRFIGVTPCCCCFSMFVLCTGTVVARELAPAGVRSAPQKKPAPAALSNGSKLPRHNSAFGLSGEAVTGLAWHIDLNGQYRTIKGVIQGTRRAGDVQRGELGPTEHATGGTADR